MEHICVEELVTEEYKMTRALAKQIAENEIFPVRQQIDDDRDHTQVIGPLFKKILLGLGLQRAIVDDRPTPMVNYCGFAEEIARGDSGVAVVLACTGWCVAPLQYEPYKRPDLLRELTRVFLENKES